MIAEIAYSKIFGETEKKNRMCIFFFLFGVFSFSLNFQVVTESIFSIKYNLHRYFLEVQLKYSSCYFERQLKLAKMLTIIHD